MHRREQLNKLIADWLELDLPQTCVALDQYNSVRIDHFKHTPNRLYITHKLRGKENQICTVYLMPDNTLGGIVMPDNTPTMSLVLFGLEKAIETY